MLYDRDIREPLFDYLEERYGKVRVIEEKQMGRSRADIVMVLPGELAGIEIKSDADTYARLERQVKELQRQNGEDHKEIRDRLSRAEMTNAVQNERYDAILGKLEELSRKHDGLTRKLEELEAKPGRRWESLAEKAVWAVYAAVIAFLLGGMGL